MVEVAGDAGGEHPEGGDGRQAGEVGAQRSGDRKGEGLQPVAARSCAAGIASGARRSVSRRAMEANATA
ncbi:hypothetical protein ABZY09_07150 [Streptomyces sp. NPDC002928]|uniref:hypothetical protein n=1 Tax=Streptomyces sp. NPDC002928 TaxID=3154440 RepID=UPI0033B7F482